MRKKEGRGRRDRRERRVEKGRKKERGESEAQRYGISSDKDTPNLTNTIEKTFYCKRQFFSPTKLVL